MDFLDLFGHCSSESVQYVERELNKVLTDLREEISEIRLTTSTDSRPFSAVPVPQDIEYYRKEKQSMIERTLKVSQARPLVKQADILKEEMENAEKLEYTANGLPLLLHQHFTDRIYQLVQCKHLHLMRWRRFCTNSKQIENVHPDYSKRVRKIISEYEDCLSRAQRLSAARVTSAKSQSNVLKQIRLDDLLIYLRWLICHLNSTKKFNQFLKVLQWLPVSHREKFSSHRFSEVPDHQAKPVNRLSVRYDDIKAGQKNVGHSAGTFSDILKKARMIKDPQVNTMSTQAMPSSVMSWALGFLGGGRCSNDLTLEIPVHSLKFHDFKNQLKFLALRYGIECKIDNIKNLKDEMGLYLETYKKFMTVFAEQEATKVFAAYDSGEPNQKMDRLIKKRANWIPFIKIKPVRNAFQEKEWAELRNEQQMDILLQQQADFFKINDAEKIMAVLQKHTAILSEENSLESINQMNEKCLQKTEALWKKIYSGSNLSSMKAGNIDADLNDDDEEAEDSSKLQKFQSEYSYTTTIKMLGLDLQNQDETDSVMNNGAYLSLLFLRHLRVRDLQYSTLLSLNYLRSIERTLTISDGGLSSDGEKLSQTSPQNHRNLTELNGTLGGGGGLGSFGYLHNTPADFKISETDFLGFSDADSHDDFYEIKDANIYVQDQKGFYIIYDEAINDLNALEEDLLLLSSHYIDKDKNLRNTYLTNRRKFLMSEEINNNFLSSEYPFMHVDRFGILLDFWTQEVAFNNCKRELIRCYFEAYNNVFDRDERRLLAQTITQVIHQRPRFHPEYTQYFNNTYFNECISLHLYTSLVTEILNKQIEDQRDFISRIKDEQHGLPWTTVNKFPVSIHCNKSALKPLFLLEFHPSLAVASRIPKAIDHIVQELSFLGCVNDSENIFVIERTVLEIALKEWKSMKIPGLSFSEEVQRDLFFNNFVENPSLMSQMAANLIGPPEYGSRRPYAQKQLQMIEKVQSVLEIVSLRHRQIDAAWETEVLSKLYIQQAQKFNFGEHHLHLRIVPFELASYEHIKKAEPVYITSALEDDPSIDRYIPRDLQLAIHQYDMVQVGQFSFKTRGSIEELLTPDGIKKLQVILKCQICQRNSLLACVQQVYFCHTRVIKAEKRPLYKTKTAIKLESRISRFRTKSKLFDTESGHMDDMDEDDAELNYSETFLSLQLKKLRIRDSMLINYLRHLNEVKDMNMQQTEAYKRKVISGYCDVFSTHMSQYSLRTQIIAYYKSLMKILNRFPLIKSAYFVTGSHKREIPGTTQDAAERVDTKHRVLSVDGKEICNIWYLPHPTEIVHRFKSLDERSCIEALTNMLTLCSALHDIVHYIFAHVELGNKHVKFFTGLEESSVDSGGVEGIKSQFHEIQSQIRSLSKPNCPVLVAELLILRRDIIFLEFDLSLRHSVSETFLMSGNRAAYEALSQNMNISLTLLSDATRDSLFNMYLKVPEPLEASDERAKSLYPWKSFLGCNGPFPTLFWPFYMIGYYVQLCMSSLKDVDRTIASGEILGVSLAMEDMLLSEFPSIKELRRDSLAQFTPVDTTSLSSVARTVLSRKANKRKISIPCLSIDMNCEEALDEEVMQKVDPIDIYTLLQFCLSLWKQLEIVKREWVELWQQMFSGDPIDDYVEICKIYREEVMFPVLQSLAKKYGQIDLYVGIAQISDPLVIPKGTSELEVKICQLKRILENLDYQMTRRLLKKCRLDLSLAVAERSREEMILPTDLWKDSVSTFHCLNEPISLTYPTTMMDFRDKLLSQAQKSQNDSIISCTDMHLGECLESLAQGIVEREKYTYKSYTNHFEKIIKAYHAQLHQKEQEINQFREEQNSLNQSITAAVECQMADRTFNLLMEITRLRHEVDELKAKNMEKKTAVHAEVREDYSKLVENFFLASSELREKFDVFRHELKDDVMEKITTVRRQAIEEMEKVRAKYNLTLDRNDLQKKLSKAEEVHLLQADNVQLNILLLKLRTINTWRQNFSQANYMKAINKLMKDVNKLKRENIKLSLMSSKENQLLKQQVMALRQELACMVKEFASVRLQLDAESRAKEEKLHRSKQIYEYEQQIEHVKQEHMDKLLDELSQKEMQLRALNKNQEQSRSNSAGNQSKNVVVSLKKFLEQERSLKLKAFQEVDHLRYMVDKLEIPVCSKNRPKSAISSFTSRPQSTYKLRQTSSRASVPSHSIPAVTPMSSRTGWAKKRPQTVEPKDASSSDGRKMIQRPKTVTGYFRSQMGNQLTTQEDLYALTDIIDSADK